MGGRAAMKAAMGNRDANHREITEAYEALYCIVQDTHAVGGGYPDLNVKISTRRGPVVALVEVKTRDGKLSPSQLRFIGEWGSCVTVVQTRDDVFAHVERVRA
jgi:VRR-NUC domain